ncbi:MAG: DedA family protein [Actinomycetota bacterium]|nr:DedA family protein [Actinomycetota bacterium]
MQTLQSILDVILHVDVFIDQQVGVWGAWMYLVMFVVIFCETGLVVTPFLPGDTLLFAAGVVAARAGNPLDVWLLFLILTIAAILGDTVNYWLGKRLGPRVLRNPNSRIFKKEHLDKTHAFFERYGGKTIILCRFVPFVRTFAPFLAGVGEMTYGRFLAFNVVGGVVWVAVFLFAGFFFGRIPWVEKNLTLVLLLFVVVTTIPIVIEYVRARRDAAREVAASAVPEAADEA